jgi:cytidine deaminase
MNLNNAIHSCKIGFEASYAPYSNYHVGAALVCKNGKIYTGCNIENHGIMSICAERVAFTKAISEGEKDIDYIVVCGGKDLNNLENCLPCGYCRQFMSEFVDTNFKVYALGPNNEITPYSMNDLLPNNFSL